MAATAAAHQLLLAEVGDTPDGVLAGLEAPLWAAGAALAGTPAIQEQAVKIRMVDILIAYWRDQLSRVLTEDERETMELRLTSLRATRATAVTTQSTLLATRSATGRVGVGQMTARAPIESLPGRPNANSSVWRGDPNRRRGWP